MKLEDAIEAARQQLQNLASHGETAVIITWPDNPLSGLRVAEVGWSTGRGGAVYMQSDPDGLLVCAAVERLILEFLNGDDRDQGDESEVARQIDLLEFIINGKAVEP